ncbi:ornithine cyclodeaminase family protein [Palleronia caenipelagi]|uniref:Ornithine cyclodeaminase n=1 Tax=Palleronia caenipelagi TaxID=2489174 RepID=A0A547Q6I5_9RHOB|nr:ornithine cyclodeaminase [Palleronia caenipelagi]TRD21995.1 ornithine cyclodeaminase [Palleronia caenipelagi]
MALRMITGDDLPDAPDWHAAVAALEAGHRLPRAEVGDIFLGPAGRTLLSRGARIEGLGFGQKSVTVYGDNPKAGLPTVQGAMLLFDDTHGTPLAVIDSALVTDLKTAADSVLGARLLARSDSRTLLIAGAGQVARNLVAAYGAIFPALERILIWARRPEQAQALVDSIDTPPAPLQAVADLTSAARAADIISTATMATAPILRGDWLRPGTHVDLIGAFKADMREADDTVLRRGRLFVDSRDTTLGHIGELMIPVSERVITAQDVVGDLYDLVAGRVGRETPEDITVFKNGGGAHLDLMIARMILEQAVA